MEFMGRFGCPLELHSDQGRNFESNIFRELCKLLEIRKTRTSPRHPEGNGQVERYNRTLIKMIKSYINKQEDWDLYLGCLTAAYWATPQETTKLTPNMIMLGREVRFPMEVIGSIYKPKIANDTFYGEYVDKMRTQLEEAHNLTRKNLQSATQKQQESYDAKLCLNTYKPETLYGV